MEVMCSTIHILSGFNINKEKSKLFILTFALALDSTISTLR